FPTVLDTGPPGRTAPATAGCPQSPSIVSGDFMKQLTRRTATALVAAALTLGGLTATAQAAPAAPAARTAPAAEQVPSGRFTPAGGDPTLTDVYLWATNVNLRARPTRQSNVLAVRSQYWLDALC